jgi:transketolase N-terminal domain/subunit
LIFTENIKDDGERYNGRMEWNAIANIAARKMQNFVQLVNKENFVTFVGRNDKPKVLYFTDKKQTSIVLKALSKKYLDKLSIGEVRSSDELTQ